MPNPALDDPAGWTAMVAQIDAMVTEMLAGMTLPMDSELQQIGGVPTWVVTPDRRTHRGRRPGVPQHPRRRR